MSTNLSCGIDFGTSNSVCALSNGKAVHLAAVEGEKETLPSAIFFAEAGPVLYGREAIIAYIDGEEGRLMRGLKSVLGTSLMQEKTMIRRRAIAFTDILAHFLAHLKRKIEAQAGQEVSSVVMGRPVHFHDDDTDADAMSEDTLRNIAHDIGFRDVQFQYEPIAAAYAHEQNIEGEKLAVVIDLGGGTSDFTVMRLSAQRSFDQDRQKDILATAGIRIGGTNFDKQLSLKTFMPHLGLGSTYHDAFDASKILPIPSNTYHDLADWPKVHHAQTRQAVTQTRQIIRTADAPHLLENLLSIQENALGHALLQTVEAAKIDLSSNDNVRAVFDEWDTHLVVELLRNDFVDAIETDIARIRNALEDCIKQAAINREDIQLVILTGGSAQLPIIQSMVKDIFPSAILSGENTFSSVGLGLGLQARASFS